MAAPKLEGLKLKSNRNDLTPRWDIYFDGVKLGWAYKDREGWSGYAIIGRDAPFHAMLVCLSEPKRSYAVNEVLLRVYQSGNYIVAHSAEKGIHDVPLDRHRLRQELGLEG